MQENERKVRKSSPNFSCPRVREVTRPWSQSDIEHIRHHVGLSLGNLERLDRNPRAKDKFKTKSLFFFGLSSSFSNFIII